jgi:hypothetical protein
MISIPLNRVCCQSIPRSFSCCSVNDQAVTLSVTQTLHKLREDRRLQAFDAVRGFFVEGRALHPDSGFRELDHVRVCVRSPQQVLGYFWPRGA